VLELAGPLEEALVRGPGPREVLAGGGHPGLDLVAAHVALAAAGLGLFQLQAQVQFLLVGGLGGRLEGFGLLADGLRLPQEDLHVGPGHPDLQALQLVLGLLVALVARDGLAALLDAALDLLEDVAQADQVGGRVLQLARGLLLAEAVAVGAGRLLQHAAPVLGIRGEDHVHLLAAQHRERARADPRAHQEFVDVLQAAGGAVDEVLRVAVAGGLAGDGHLAEVHRQMAVRVVEDGGDLTQGGGPAGGRAREDQLFQAGGPQRLGALLAQAIADGVGQVALAASVGAHDGHEARHELHLGPFREGLESAHLDALEEQV